MGDKSPTQRLEKVTVFIAKAIKVRRGYTTCQLNPKDLICPNNTKIAFTTFYITKKPSFMGGNKPQALFFAHSFYVGNQSKMLYRAP
ncbi:MAG: hypothetical protein IJN86_08330 [Clostridia bacterium]|nr:hypothetical protein [Clostridia bacterium]